MNHVEWAKNLAARQGDKDAHRIAAQCANGNHNLATWYKSALEWLVKNRPLPVVQDDQIASTM